MKKNQQTQTIIRRVIAASSLGVAGLSQAVTLVQINFLGNTITANNGNQLFADMDFDGNDDLVFTNSGHSSNTSGQNYGGVNINGAGRNLGSFSPATSSLGSATRRKIKGIDGESAGWVTASFNTSSLGTHQGFLQVTNSVAGSASGVAIVRFVYDKDAETTNEALLVLTDDYTSIGTTTATSTTIVPEPSSLALLALGAGGVMLRRKRQKAQA